MPQQPDSGLNRRSFLGTSAGASLAGASLAGASLAGASQCQAAAPAGDDEPQKAAEVERPNEKIQHARNVALGLLKPSAQQLQRGLELHADALVFDTYGFAPRSAVDGDALANLMQQGGSDLEIQDAREDMSMTRCVIDLREQAEFLQAWRAAGVTCIFQNAGEEGQAPLTLIKRLARFTYLTDMLGKHVAKAATPDDIVAAKREGRHCLYLTGNGVPLTQQWVSVPDELRYVRIFQQLGIRMMHMTYQRRNMIGDGCAEPANAGLSDFGRSVVAEMNRLGVIVDVAHSGWQTSLEAAQMSQKPMVASHTTCATRHHHIRSKPDNVIRAIADTGGLIGICCVPRFLGGTGDIRVLLDQITYAARKFGVDHVGIGTDVAYTSRTAVLENKKLPRRQRRRTGWRSLWPQDGYVTTPEARESMAWTNWPLFTVGLVQRGFSDEEVRKIIGGNMLRVAQSAFA